VKLKGVNYDVGRVLQGHLQRPVFDTRVVHRELEIIKHDLHCNAVKIQGYGIDRLMTAAEDALKQGLKVWLAPELFDKSQEETFEYTVQAATAAETLRQNWPDLVLSIGTELTLFMQGIVEGETFMERLGNPALREHIMLGTYLWPLHAYLTRTTKAVRKVFHGRVTYAALSRLERVDWSLFDVICLDEYRDKLVRHREKLTGESYSDSIKRYFLYNKPIVIGEFGCCTYQGAEDMGGRGWDIVDWMQIPPRLKGEYVYDQGVQARELADQLQVLDSIGVDGAFVFTFVQPGPEVTDALVQMLQELPFDPDIASYSLVKSLLKHGTTYPDMLWEPKESFKAVAEYYAGH
jgi:hypothetical protein